MDARRAGAVAGTRNILVINPNTNPAVTERVRAAAQSVVSPGTRIRAVNPPSGPFGIESPADRALAEPSVIELIREGAGQGFEAFVLACFDDIALAAARDLVDAPVVGSCEAGIGVTRTLARRFSVVTTFAGAIPTVEGLLQRYAVSDIATVRAAGISVAQAARGDDGDQDVAAAFRAAIDTDRAGAILLGSGGLAGRAGALSRRFRVPVIDATAAAVKLAESALTLTAA